MHLSLLEWPYIQQHKVIENQFNILLIRHLVNDAQMAKSCLLPWGNEPSASLYDTTSSLPQTP